MSKIPRSTVMQIISVEIHHIVYRKEHLINSIGETYCDNGWEGINGLKIRNRHPYSIQHNDNIKRIRNHQCTTRTDSDSL